MQHSLLCRVLILPLHSYSASRPTDNSTLRIVHCTGQTKSLRMLRHAVQLHNSTMRQFCPGMYEMNSKVAMNYLGAVKSIAAYFCSL